MSDQSQRASIDAELDNAIRELAEETVASRGASPAGDADDPLAGLAAIMQPQEGAAKQTPPSPPPSRPLATLRPLAGRERPSAVPSLRNTALDDEVAGFLASAEKMVGVLRQRMADAESAFVLERAKLADNYRRRIAELEDEAADAIIKMEANHRDDMAKRKRMMDSLLAMRGE